VDHTQIVYEVTDHVATITLNRPDRLNALTPTMARELLDAFDRSDADDDVRAVIVTGAGKGFCAGADLAGGVESLGDAWGDFHSSTGATRDGGGIVSLRIHASLKPVIGAINGVSVGVGVTLTLPMDIRLASTSARFGFVFARRGFVPEACSSWFLPRIVGISTAAEWVYTGRMVGAADALNAGLVRSTHAPEDLLPVAYGLAAEIADGTSPVAVALSRQMLWRMLSEDHPMAAHRADSRAVAVLRSSADAVEGVASFLEKRSPVFPQRVSTGLPDLFPDWTEPEFD
jgi:enoyl-CoA hydratase/carnithine racemase